MKCPYCKGTGDLDPDQNTIGTMVRLLRLHKGWTQKELGKKAGLGAGVVYGVEVDRNTTIKTLTKLARALQCRVGDLLPF